MKVAVTLNLRLVSEANARDHWARRAKRAREQRHVTWLMLRKYGEALLAGEDKLTVTITRIGVRKLDGDNLQRSCKAVRDGVADALYLDDADPRIVWRYEQETAKSYQTKVVIETAGESEVTQC